MTVQLITFDLDDTLWDTAPVIVSAEAILREWLGVQAPNLGAVPVEHLWAIRERVLNNEPGLKHRISALRRRVLFHALEEAGYDHGQASDLADQSFEVFLHARHQIQVFPEVEPTLEILANHYALGVVTNGNADKALGHLLLQVIHFSGVGGDVVEVPLLIAHRRRTGSCGLPTMHRDA